MLGGLVTVTFFCRVLKGGKLQPEGAPMPVTTRDSNRLTDSFATVVFSMTLATCKRFHSRNGDVPRSSSWVTPNLYHPSKTDPHKRHPSDLKKTTTTCPFWLRREVLITLLRCMPTYRMDVGKSVGVWLVKDLLHSFPPASFHVVIWIDPPQLEVTKITPFQGSRIKPPMLLSHSDEPGVSRCLAKSCWPKAKKTQQMGLVEFERPKSRGGSSHHMFFWTWNIPPKHNTS